MNFFNSMLLTNCIASSMYLSNFFTKLQNVLISTKQKVKHMHCVFQLGNVLQFRLLKIDAVSEIFSQTIWNTNLNVYIFKILFASLLKTVIIIVVNFHFTYILIKYSILFSHFFFLFWKIFYDFSVFLMLLKFNKFINCS